MNITVSVFISLDGVIQAPGGPEEDTDGGFAHGGWSLQFFDPAVMGPKLGESMAKTEALLFGRKTYEGMAAAWPGRAGDPFADQMNAIKKYVVSNTLTPEDVTWENTTLLTGPDAMDQVKALKANAGGDLQVIGCATLAQELIAAGLVDELNLMLEPVILGGGKKLYPEDGVGRVMELVSTTPTSTGVQVCTYRFTDAELQGRNSDEFYE